MDLRKASRRAVIEDEYARLGRCQTAPLAGWPGECKATDYGHAGL